MVKSAKRKTTTPSSSSRSAPTQKTKPSERRMVRVRRRRSSASSSSSAVANDEQQHQHKKHENQNDNESVTSHSKDTVNRYFDSILRTTLGENPSQQYSYLFRPTKGVDDDADADTGLLSSTSSFDDSSTAVTDSIHHQDDASLASSSVASYVRRTLLQTTSTIHSTTSAPKIQPHLSASQRAQINALSPIAASPPSSDRRQAEPPQDKKLSSFSTPLGEQQPPTSGSTTQRSQQKPSLRRQAENKLSESMNSGNNLSDRPVVKPGEEKDGSSSSNDDWRIRLQKATTENDSLQERVQALHEIRRKARQRQQLQSPLQQPKRQARQDENQQEETSPSSTEATTATTDSSGEPTPPAAQTATPAVTPASRSLIVGSSQPRTSNPWKGRLHHSLHKPDDGYISKLSNSVDLHRSRPAKMSRSLLRPIKRNGHSEQAEQARSKLPPQQQERLEVSLEAEKEGRIEREPILTEVESELQQSRLEPQQAQAQNQQQQQTSFVQDDPSTMAPSPAPTVDSLAPRRLWLGQVSEAFDGKLQQELGPHLESQGLLHISKADHQPSLGAATIEPFSTPLSAIKADPSPAGGTHTKWYTPPDADERFEQERVKCLELARELEALESKYASDKSLWQTKLTSVQSECERLAHKGSMMQVQLHEQQEILYEKWESERAIRMEGEREQILDKISSLETQHAEATTELQTQLNRAREDRVRIMTERDGLSSQLEELKNKQASVVEDHVSKEEMQVEINKIRQDLQECRSERDELSNGLKLSTSRHSKEIDQWEASLDAAKQAYSKQIQQVKTEHEADWNRLQSRLDEITDRYRQAQADLLLAGDSKAQLIELQTKYDEVDHERDTLYNEMLLVKNQHSQEVDQWRSRLQKAKEDHTKALEDATQQFQSALEQAKTQHSNDRNEWLIQMGEVSERLRQAQSKLESGTAANDSSWKVQVDKVRKTLQETQVERDGLLAQLLQIKNCHAQEMDKWQSRLERAAEEQTQQLSATNRRCQLDIQQLEDKHDEQRQQWQAQIEEISDQWRQAQNNCEQLEEEIQQSEATHAREIEEWESLLEANLAESPRLGGNEVDENTGGATSQSPVNVQALKSRIEWLEQRLEEIGRKNNKEQIDWHGTLQELMTTPSAVVKGGDKVRGYPDEMKSCDVGDDIHTAEWKLEVERKRFELLERHCESLKAKHAKEIHDLRQEYELGGNQSNEDQDPLQSPSSSCRPAPSFDSADFSAALPNERRLSFDLDQVIRDLATEEAFGKPIQDFSRHTTGSNSESHRAAATARDEDKHHRPTAQRNEAAGRNVGHCEIQDETTANIDPAQAVPLEVDLQVSPIPSQAPCAEQDAAAQGVDGHLNSSIVTFDSNRSCLLDETMILAHKLTELMMDVDNDAGGEVLDHLEKLSFLMHEEGLEENSAVLGMQNGTLSSPIRSPQLIQMLKDRIQSPTSCRRVDEAADFTASSDAAGSTYQEETDGSQEQRVYQYAPWQALVDELQQKCQFLEQDRLELVRLTNATLAMERDTHRLQVEAAVATEQRQASEQLILYQQQTRTHLKNLYCTLCCNCQRRISVAE